MPDPGLAPPLSRTPLPWGLVAGYFALFLLLDWASFIRPLEGLNITPWNPQPALAVALLMANRRLWWAVLAALGAAEVLVRGAPGDLLVVALAAAALTCSYLAMASALERLLDGGWRLRTGRDLARFQAVIAAGALLSGAVYVGAYAAGGHPPPGNPWAAIARYWVGDAVGLTVTLPILLAALDLQRREQLLQTLRQRQAWAIGALILLLLWLLFGGGGERLQYAYLLLLPVIWASLRFGAAGAVLASLVLQLGLIVALHSGPHADPFFFQLQLLMVAITVTAHLLGVVVDERSRSEAELRRTLRLAAAGQMSAALAHELSQPLNALALYAQACELLADPGQAPSPQRQAQLLEVVRRMSGDARRAGAVVTRLRDFFRTGATQLEPVDLRALVDEALQVQSARARAAGALLTAQVDPQLPPVWVDAVQIQVVLRNLLANALDAALAGRAGHDGSGAAPPAVQLRVTAGTRELSVLVSDNGPGFSPAQAGAILEPAAAGVSHKAGGMGVGLSICRAIVEAHGGRLWAEPGDGGRLCLMLPLESPLADPAPAPDA